MRAFASSSVPGWVVGLQGAADTLGTASDAIRQDRALEQRQKEEERRQQAQDLEIQQAMEKIQARKAQQQVQYGQAQQALGSERDALFAQLQGGPPTVEQDQELQQLAELTKELKPETAGVVLDHYRTQKATQSAIQGIASYSQEMMQPIAEGTVQDPMVQQQFEMIGQQLQAVAQGIESGQVPPQAALKAIEAAHEHQQSVLGDYAKKQADLQVRQKSAMQIQQRLDMIQPGSPKYQGLAEMQQMVMLGMMQPKDVGKALLADEYDISPEEIQKFETISQLKQMGEVMGQAAMQATQGRGLERFQKSLETLKSKGKVTGDDIRKLMKRHGVTEEQLQGLLSG